MKKVNAYQSLISDRKLNDLLSEDAKEEKEANKKLLWYHGRSINRKKTETLLTSKEWKSGTFLVRDSFSSHGDFVLSVRHDVGKNTPAVEHFKIFRNPNDCYYKLDKNKQSEIHGLEKLIEFYQAERHGLPAHLDRFIPLNSPPPESRQSGRTNALHHAIQGGVELNVLNILKHKKCPNINSRDAEGTPVLYMACEAGMLDAVEQMLRSQVKVFAKNARGYSSLHVACKKDKVDIVTMLLDIGHASPIDICRHNRYSPMHIAAEEGHLDCLRVLVKYGAPDRPREINGCIPYELAKANNRTNVIRFLDNYETVLDPVISRKDWLHEQQTRNGANALFHKLGTTDGIFLIRKSSKGVTYALSLCFEQQVFHYEIKVMKNLVYYIDDGPMMTSLEMIVSHHIRFCDGLPCRLKTAVSPSEILMDLEVLSGVEPEADDKKEQVEPECTLYDEVGDTLPPPVPASRPALPAAKGKSAAVKDPLASVLISNKHITLGVELGQGEFGSVLKGIYTKPEGLRKKTINVAVKTLLDSPLTASKDDFFREARVMLELDHPNVVKLVGVCEGPPVMIIQELVKMGSMLDYLWDYEDEIQVDTDLILWAAQIANGMKFLEAKKFVHRDLAARNILLAEKTLAKISDFGLSRAVGSGSDYYKASKGGRWPVKWYAPESVNYGTFSHASDVWSFGITLYEMFTFGEQPYGEKSGAEVIQMLDRGHRLERPAKCPSHVYELMEKCWSANAADRPTFNALFTSFASDPSFSRAKSIIGQQKKGKLKHRRH